MAQLELKLFYKTQRELASALNSVIDAYWESEIDETILIKEVEEIYKNNPNRVLKNGDFTTILKQQCGKRRLEVVNRILDMNGHLGE
ncbi:TIGR04540 family protein [Cytobacillus sp. Hz8]|uniref:TIGR04540 family protein n=1 Tax=Cytobacillus sp. Hz8 TaxID=3347168 RepID=UPI0035DF5C2E